MKKLISAIMILVTVFALMIPVFASADTAAATEMWVNCADGKRLNVYFSILDPTPDCPAHSIADRHIVADFEDVDKILEMAEGMDVVTYEFEHISLKALQILEAHGHKVYPSAETLEHSIGTSRSRNAAAFIQAIPFCLVLDRYAVVRPAFWSGIPAAWSAPATIGLVAAFLLVRRLLYAFFRPRRLSGESFDALRHNLYNYLLLLVPLLLLTVAVLTPAHVPDAAGRRILTGEILAVWAFALVRSGQILGAHGSGLSTFLYLCGLELLPAALLAAVVVFF